MTQDVDGPVSDYPHEGAWVHGHTGDEWIPTTLAGRSNE